MPKVGPCKTLFVDSGKLCLWSLENGDFWNVSSFLQFSIAIDQWDIVTINNKQTKHYLSKICWLHAAILAKVYLTWLTYTGKYIFLQLRPNCLKNMLKHENFSKPRIAVDLNKSDGGGRLALAQRGRGDPCHYHVLSVLTQILTFLVLAGRHLAWGEPVQRGERHLSLLLAIQVHLSHKVGSVMWFQAGQYLRGKKSNLLC